MNKCRSSSERGQSLVLAALLFLAFAAILALVLDGGIALAARRSAQNAADAGALAGASYMCKHRDAAGGVNKAIEYTTKNGAVNPPVVYANLNIATVVVTATVQKDTFFASLIGIPRVSPRAVAEAQCRPPVGMGVLPVAWSCRERVIDVEGLPLTLPGISCAEKLGPCKGDPLSCMYILMDSVKVANNKKGGKCDPDITDPKNSKYCYTQNDIICDDPTDNVLSPGTIDCDLDNDHINELMAGGARSWLDLNGGGGGASELSNWIKNGYAPPIPPHTWLPEESGVATSIFHTVAASVVGKEVLLPVFNKICDHYPNDLSDPETYASCNVGPPEDYEDRTKAGNNMNFHVASFSLFHVTCVQTSKTKATDETGKLKSCLGHDWAVSNNSIDENDKTIEGYFTKDQIFGYGGSGNFVDVGTFVVVLVR